METPAQVDLPARPHAMRLPHRRQQPAALGVPVQPKLRHRPGGGRKAPMDGEGGHRAEPGGGWCAAGCGGNSPDRFGPSRRGPAPNRSKGDCDGTRGWGGRPYSHSHRHAGALPSPWPDRPLHGGEPSLHQWTGLAARSNSSGVPQAASLGRSRISSMAGDWSAWWCASFQSPSLRRWRWNSCGKMNHHVDYMGKSSVDLLLSGHAELGRSS